MLEHVVKLVWNRRRANALVMVEIAAAFVVTFVLAALVVNLWNNYRQPLGFEYENVWSVSVSKQDGGGFGMFAFGSDNVSDTLSDVTTALRSLPGVRAVEPIALPPFVGLRWNGPFGADADNTFLGNINRTTTEALQNIGVELIDGRWFEPSDEGRNFRPALVNRAFVERAFGSSADALGRQISFPDPNFPYDQVPESQAREMQRYARVVGVIDDFRQWGEFESSRPYVIQMYEPTDARGATFTLLVRVEPGTQAGYEEDVIANVESIAPGWTAAIRPWAQLRAETHSNTLLPIKVASTIATFFLALVVMGLIGVLWQEVVRRTQEIGLRRALGATATTVRRQIQLEMIVVGACGILVGGVIAVQFPLLDILDDIDWTAALAALILAAVLILILVVLGALYPSWLAARREPADALRYE